MAKKLLVGVIAINLIVMLSGVIMTMNNSRMGSVAVADNSSPYLVSADVPAVLELTTTLYQTVSSSSDVNFKNPVTSINFGTLSEAQNSTGGGLGYMAGQYWYTALLTGASSGRRYQIQETGETLIGSNGGSIGTGSTEDAYLMVPEWNSVDNGNATTFPSGASVGIVAPAARSGNIVYDSGTNGLAKTARAYLSIGGPDKDGTKHSCSQGVISGSCNGQQNYNGGTNGNYSDLVTRDQKAGSYSGKVTFTINLIS